MYIQLQNSDISETAFSIFTVWSFQINFWTILSSCTKWWGHYNPHASYSTEKEGEGRCYGYMQCSRRRNLESFEWVELIKRQLRVRRALLLFKDVSLRTRMVLSLHTKLRIKMESFEWVKLIKTLVDRQKGVTAIQRCFAENQKGAITAYKIKN